MPESPVGQTSVNFEHSIDISLSFTRYEYQLLTCIPGA